MAGDRKHNDPPFGACAFCGEEGTYEGREPGWGAIYLCDGQECHQELQRAFEAEYARERDQVLDDLDARWGR